MHNVNASSSVSTDVQVLSTGCSECREFPGSDVVFGATTVRGGGTKWEFEGTCAWQSPLPLKMMENATEEEQCYLEDGYFVINNIKRNTDAATKQKKFKFKSGTVVDAYGANLEVLDDGEFGDAADYFFVFSNSIMLKSATAVKREAKR